MQNGEELIQQNSKELDEVNVYVYWKMYEGGTESHEQQFFVK